MLRDAAGRARGYAGRGRKREPACGGVKDEVIPVSPRLADKDTLCFRSDFTEPIPFHLTRYEELGGGGGPHLL